MGGRLNLRGPDEEIKLIELAARQQKRSVSNYVLIAAVEKAKKDLSYAEFSGNQQLVDTSQPPKVPEKLERKRAVKAPVPPPGESADDSYPGFYFDEAGDEIHDLAPPPGWRPSWSDRSSAW